MKVLLHRISDFFFEGIIFRVLSFIIPPKKDLILFGSGFNRFSDNPKYLFLYYQKKKEYTVIWISPKRSEVKELRSKGYKSYYKWGLRAFLAVVRAPVIFISHNVKDIFPFIPKRTFVINLWHGTPIKKIGFDSKKELEWINKFLSSGRKLPYQRWDYFISSSPYTSSIFESAMQIPSSKIKPLGQPRTDMLSCNLRQTKKTIAYTHKKNRNPKKKVLFAPTFRNNKDSTRIIRQSLIEMDRVLGKFSEIMIVFKPHPLDSKSFDDEFYKTVKNVVNGSLEDTQQLLAEVDLLITDYSSIMFDFMITSKPIIIYAFDLESYKAINGGLYFSYEELGTIIVKDHSELTKNIINLDSIKVRYNGLRFNTMNSCENIYEFLKTVGN